jgi:S1-C subfamily serine protease
MQFFQQDPDQQAPPETNQGSGFFITSDGYILTNNHVLEDGDPKHLEVTLKDGRKFLAKIVGTDPISDLAVLKINATHLPVEELGDSDKARVGQFAFALGAPYDLRNTFTYGIVSAKGRTDITGSRDYEEYLQTDASINPGNSGGPLVDIDGRVIGVNTLINGLNRGLGFAIPINMAKRVASQLIADGRASRPWLGIQIRGVEDIPGLSKRYPDLPSGILVYDIVGGTPASTSDLRRNDIITSVDGVPVATARELQKVILDKKVGDEVSLQVWRNHQVLTVKVRTAEHTDGVLPVVNQRMQPAPSQGGDDDSADDSQDDSASPGAQDNNGGAPPHTATAGMSLKAVTPDLAMALKLQAQEGVLVTGIQPGSEAATAGVKVGDVVTSVGSSPVRTPDDLVRALGDAEGDGVLLNINRGDQKTYEILKR